MLLEVAHNSGVITNQEYAEENQCDIDNITIDGTDYPENIEW